MRARCASRKPPMRGALVLGVRRLVEFHFLGLGVAIDNVLDLAPRHVLHFAAITRKSKTKVTMLSSFRLRANGKLRRTSLCVEAPTTFTWMTTSPPPPRPPRRGC